MFAPNFLPRAWDACAPHNHVRVELHQAEGIEAAQARESLELRVAFALGRLGRAVRHVRIDLRPSVQPGWVDCAIDLRLQGLPRVRVEVAEADAASALARALDRASRAASRALATSL